MAIFNSYVKLPEGSTIVSLLGNKLLRVITTGWEVTVTPLIIVIHNIKDHENNHYFQNFTIYIRQKKTLVTNTKTKKLW